MYYVPYINVELMFVNTLSSADAQNNALHEDKVSFVMELWRKRGVVRLRYKLVQEGNILGPEQSKSNRFKSTEVEFHLCFSKLQNQRFSHIKFVLAWES